MIDKTSLIFTGDIGFDKYMDKMWKDDNLVSDEVLSYLKSADHLVINVEGPLSSGETGSSETGAKALIHSMDPQVASFFDKIGADVWNICNNHIMDAGEKGIKDTLDIAKKRGVLTLGAGMNIDEAKAPIIFPEAGGIGLVAAGYERACRQAGEDSPGCINFSRMDIIKEQIEHVKKTCRWCIVVAHDGEEFTALPMPYTRERYIEYLSMGADIVVAHHPHVPMNYETFKTENEKLVSINSEDYKSIMDGSSDKKIDKAIFYSLGNFIFDTDYQRSQFNTDKGLFLKLNFTEDHFEFEPFGIRIDRETEHVVAGEIPEIFENVCEEDYMKLLPLAAKMFIENTKRQLKYLKPDVFNSASEEDYKNNFYEPLRSGRVPGKVLDFQIVYPLSLKYDEKEIKLCKLDKVIRFMKDQL